MKDRIWDAAIGVVVLFAAFTIVSSAHAQTPSIKVPPAWTAPQEQASALAVPQTQPAPPRSVIAVTRCNAIIALTVIDADGDLHPIQLEGLSRAQVEAILRGVPASHTLAINTGCAEDPTKDGTIF